MAIGAQSIEDLWKLSMIRMGRNPADYNYTIGSGGSITYTPKPGTPAATSNATVSGTISGDSTAQQIINDLQRAQSEAKAANESRYQDILSGYDQRKGDVLGLVEGMGDTAKAGLYDRYRSAEATGQQDMVSRGLTGTTVKPAMERGYRRDYEQGLGSINESLRSQQANLTGNLDMDRLQFMERRTDAYPDTGLYSQILSQLGQANATSPSSAYRTFSSSTSGRTSQPSTTTQQKSEPSTFIRPFSQAQNKPYTKPKPDLSGMQTPTNRMPTTQGGGYAMGPNGTWGIPQGGGKPYPMQTPGNPAINGVLPGDETLGIGRYQTPGNPAINGVLPGDETLGIGRYRTQVNPRMSMFEQPAYRY